MAKVKFDLWYVIICQKIIYGTGIWMGKSCAQEIG